MIKLFQEEEENNFLLLALQVLVVSNVLVLVSTRDFLMNSDWEKVIFRPTVLYPYKRVHRWGYLWCYHGKMTCVLVSGLWGPLVVAGPHPWCWAWQHWEQPPPPPPHYSQWCSVDTTTEDNTSHQTQSRDQTSS